MDHELHKTVELKAPEKIFSDDLEEAMKQGLQSSHIPPVSQAYGHRHNSLCALFCLHGSAKQTSADYCLESTTQGGYRMFPTWKRGGVWTPGVGGDPPENLLF